METTKNAVIRCFVAIKIPEPIQKLLRSVQTELQSHIRKASWTKSGNFHLTLQFLGDIRSESVAAIGESIQRGIETHLPFSVAFGGIGAFPNLARPRVIWIGMTDGASTVSTLAKVVNRELKPLGFPIDNRFHPHLTLARLRTPMNLQTLKNILRKYDTIDGGAMRVNEISLIQSQLHPNGAIYTPLSVYHFSA